MLVSLSPGAVAPQRGSPGAAGYDLCALQGGCVPARGQLLVSTGVGLALPAGRMGEIRSRSGLAVRDGVVAFHGVIDEDFRGEVKVLLISNSNLDFAFDAGTRIAQLVVVPVDHPEVVMADKLPETVRGAGAFGSTGV